MSHQKPPNPSFETTPSLFGAPIPRLKKSRRLKVLTQREARIVYAVAEALFPAEGTGMPSIEEANVVGYFDDLLEHLHLKEKLLIRSMLALLEVQSLVFNGLRPRLFTRANLDERIANLSRWEKSNIFQRRLTFMAIRTLLLWAYVDSQEAERDMGLTPGTDRIAQRYHPRPSGFATNIEEAAARARQLFSESPEELIQAATDPALTEKKS